jgi:hypothetical protein
VMQERVTRRGDLVQFGPDIEHGAHIRKAGEDIWQGAAVLEAGRVIAWPEIALLTPSASGRRLSPVHCGSLFSSPVPSSAIPMSCCSPARFTIPMVPCLPLCWRGPTCVSRR